MKSDFLILGEDPKHVSVEMMITEEMLEVMGGKNSIHFKSFQRECEQAYIKIRQRNNLWYFLFMYLHKVYPEKYTVEDIESYLIDKLVPGESNRNANTEIVKIIQNSSEIYFSLPLRVASIATILSGTRSIDYPILGLLHNIIEVSDISKAVLSFHFGDLIAEQIEILTVERTLQWDEAYKKDYYRKINNHPH